MTSNHFPSHIISDEHVDALRDLWNACDRIRRATGRYPALPCEAEPDAWFSFDTTDIAHAALACLQCPVLAECRTLADAAPKPREGVWGGKDYGRKVTARLCRGCGKGWWPQPRTAHVYCPNCRDLAKNKIGA